MIRDIAGRQNHSVKLARKLQTRKHRRERGMLVGEGMDLLLAALQGGADILEILVRRELVGQLPSELRDRAAASGGTAGITVPGADAPGMPVNIGICDQDTLDYASSLGGSADVVFLCTQPVRHLSELDLCGDLAFFLDRVGDPGNVGTLVRSAVAFGLGGVVCSPGTADPYGPKALRGGMGAQFAIPVVTDVEPRDLMAHLEALVARGQVPAKVLVADPRSGVDIRGMRREAAAIVVLGSERSGPGEAWVGMERISITQSRFDSLNVAMAGTVIAYELSRR